MIILLKKAALKSSIIYLFLNAVITFSLAKYSPAITYLYAWILSINLIIITVMAKDKFSAIINMGRTPEGSLLWLAFAGGYPGLLLARVLFNHKTTKAEFIKPMWILLIIQILAIIYYFVKISDSF